MTTTAFYEFPNALRMAFLDRLDAICPETTWNYTGDGISIDIPRGYSADIRTLATRYGLREISAWYFPLGSDNPPALMRWDASYLGSRGFRYTVHFAQ